MDNNEALVNTLEFFPNIDATQEFRVNTSTAPAEYGRAGGAIVQSSIKSGTNSYPRLGLRVRSQQRCSTPIPIISSSARPKAPALPFKRNQFGGSVGFPIIQEQAFPLR